MTNLNDNQIIINEVGPRDGFQIEQKFIPSKLKIEIIEKLALSGIPEIQVTSFVHPTKVPQMADAETVMASVPRTEGVSYNALALNLKGIERAQNCGVTNLEIGISASDTHNRKNTGISFNEALSLGDQMIHLAKRYGMKVRACIQCAFGCVYDGPIAVRRVIEMSQRFLDQGADLLLLADTTGMATPSTISSLLSALLKISANTPLGLHLHDTRGLGLVNLVEALNFGIFHFDTSMGGSGGCPFVSGAAGNIATEDTVHLLNSLNYNTGIDIGAVAQCSRILEAFLEKPLTGRLYRMTNKDSGYGC